MKASTLIGAAIAAIALIAASWAANPTAVEEAVYKPQGMEWPTVPIYLPNGRGELPVAFCEDRTWVEAIKYMLPDEDSGFNGFSVQELMTTPFGNRVVEVSWSYTFEIGTANATGRDFYRVPNPNWGEDGEPFSLERPFGWSPSDGNIVRIRFDLITQAPGLLVNFYNTDECPGDAGYVYDQTDTHSHAVGVAFIFEEEWTLPDGYTIQKGGARREYTNVLCPEPRTYCNDVLFDCYANSSDYDPYTWFDLEDYGCFEGAENGDCEPYYTLCYTSTPRPDFDVWQTQATRTYTVEGRAVYFIMSAGLENMTETNWTVDPNAVDYGEILLVEQISYCPSGLTNVMTSN